MNPIVLAIVVLVVLGLAGGVILVLASKFMAVYEDPRIAQITECLAGALRLHHRRRKPQTIMAR